MFNVEYHIFFRDINLLKNENLFFFTYDEIFLLNRAIEKIMEVKNIKRKRVLFGKEFKLKEIIKEEKESSLFGKENKIFIIYNADEMRFKKENLDLQFDFPLIFIFNDPRFPEKSKFLRDLQKGIRVHFKNVDELTAFKWLKREIGNLKKVIPESRIMALVKEKENSLLKLNNMVEILKLGGEPDEFENKKKEKEIDIKNTINLIFSLIRNRKIHPSLIWKIYEPMLYNRRVNYDYEKEIKQILRRYYERRNKY